METIIAYLITFISVYLQVPGFPQVIFSLIAKNPLVGSIIGGVTTWYFIDYLWLKFEGMHMPMLALFVVLGFNVGHIIISKNNLNESGYTLKLGEILSLLVMIIYLLIKQSSIRWY